VIPTALAEAIDDQWGLTTNLEILAVLHIFYLLLDS
jgi:hypothetical protein